MKLVLAFPPVHDPAMPHSALPHLSAYVRRRPETQAWSVRCEDLNQRFFRASVFQHDDAMLDDVRKAWSACGTVDEGVDIALAFDKRMRTHFDQWASQNPGYRVTFRNLGTPWNRRRPADVLRAARSVGPFDDTLTEFADACDADVIGINLSVEDQIIPAARLAQLLRERHPQVPLVWGGSLLSRLHPWFADHLRDLWDYLVIREGEEPLVAVLQEVEHGTPVAPDDDRIVRRDQAQPARERALQPFVSRRVTPIDETGAPDFGDYPVHQYWSLEPILPVLASRKCYWGRCSFCTIHESWDPAARTRDARSVVDELDALQRLHGVRAFRFVDEAAPPQLMRGIAELLLTRGLEMVFEIYAIAEARFRDRAFVDLLGRAGCRQAYFGVESVDPETLRLMDKQINQAAHYSEIFRSCGDSGIHVYTYTLFGYPDGPADAERRTMEFVAAEPDIHCVTVASYVPVTGSPFALRNADRLLHDGSMTEDFASLRLHSGSMAAASQLGSEAAGEASRAIYSTRPDLALTSILNDEMRLALSDRFGARFAQRATGRQREESHSELAAEAVSLMLRERVARRIDDGDVDRLS